MDQVCPSNSPNLKGVQWEVPASKKFKKINYDKIRNNRFSKNNGHPYSFSAIVNGFNELHFRKVGYPQILSYLKKRKRIFY